MRSRDKRHNGGTERPPVFPNGWIPIEESRNITCHSLITSQVFIHEIILFREKETGKIVALDAICPHLGGHFGYGGTIVSHTIDDKKDTACVRCPFHGWLFNTDGKCVSVPYAKDGRKSGEAEVFMDTP